MLEVIEFLKSEEMIVVYIVIVVASFLYFIVQCVDKFCRKNRQRQNTKELYRLVDDINKELEKENIKDKDSNNLDDFNSLNKEYVYVEPIIDDGSANRVAVDKCDDLVEENKKIFLEIKKELNDMKINNLDSDKIEDKNENVSNNIKMEEKSSNNFTNEEILFKLKEKVVNEDENLNSQKDVNTDNISFNTTLITDSSSTVDYNSIILSPSVDDNNDVLEEFNEEVINVDTIYNSEPILLNQNECLEDSEKIIDISSPELLEPIEEINYTDSNLNVTEAQEELKKITDALENASKNNNIDLTSYEEQQEKDAIISLDELIEKTKDKYENNELSLFDDETEAPISLADLEKKVDASLEATLIDFKDGSEVIKEEFENSFADYELQNSTFNDPQIIESKSITSNDETLYSHSFMSNPVISPIYGMDKYKENELELENTANYEKLDEEIKKTNEFLVALNELKNNL